MFQGFSAVRELSAGPRSVVFRAVRDRDGAPVVLKTSREPRPSRATMATFEREFRLGRSIEAPGVVRTLDRLVLDGRPVLVIEDTGSVSLDRVLAGGPLDPAVARQVALGIARSLAELHARGIIHKDVNPSNVLWNREQRRIQLADLGIATALDREAPARQTVGTLEGTLRYIAPEQTGRTNRHIDVRSDLYALGATLYEMFAGAPPFSDEDPLELVHAHLARPPAALSQVASVPGALSDLVDRLLQKEPEARYQSADGVVADLERYAADPYAAFELGTRDVERRIRIPQRLYGREADVDALLGAFERAAAGGRETVMVAGWSGIGKTALVHEMHRSVSLRRGLFLEGKFDPYRIGAPGAPVGRALGQLVRSLLGAEDAEVEPWRRRVLDGIGRNGRVLFDLVPELELLVGAQPPVPELAPAEAENRLHLVFREFVRALAGPEHPLVLFLDDLQWADLPSLRLLEALGTDAETRHLLLVGAYRANEVDAAHPLTLTLERLSAMTLELGPLPLPKVRALLVDVLRVPADDPDVGALADTICARTGGNPFFLVRLLETLGERGILAFDPVRRRWTWDLGAVAGVVRSENVVELLLERIAELPVRNRRALQAAACVGVSFDLQLLTEVLGDSAAAVQADLASAVALDLVQPLGGGWKLEEGDPLDAIPERELRYAFVHDRIQQAAYDSLGPDEAPALHRRLGELLRDRTGEPFLVVNHLNRARPLLDADERVQLAGYNLDACRLARRAAAFGSAYEYAEAGIACLPPGWHPTLATPLHLEGAESAYLSARFDRMEALLAAATAHAVHPLEQVHARRIEIDARIARSDLLGAIATSQAALAVLGRALPNPPSDDDVGASVGRAMGAVGEDPGRLARLPDATDPLVLAAMDILARTATPAYYAVPKLLPVVSCDLAALSVEHGLSPASPFAFAVYGIVLNSIGMFQAGHAVGELALALLERPGMHGEARTRHVVNNLVCVWIPPFESRIPLLKEAIRIGRDTGDLEYAAVAAHCYVHNAFYAGWDLPALVEEADRFTTFMRNYRQDPMLLAHNPIVHAMKRLAGLDGGEDGELHLRHALASDSRSAVFISHLQRTILDWHLGTPAQAWASAQAAWPYQDGTPSTYHLPVFHMLAAVSALAAARGGDVAAVMQRVDESLGHLRRWADAGPANHLHRVRLVEAELAWTLGDRANAERLFREAVDAVDATGAWRNDSALILERAARFFMEGSSADRLIGRAFLEQAWHGYGTWGAAAVRAKLEAEFPLILASTARRNTRTHTTGRSTELHLDAETVVRASHAISAQLELGGLLTTLFRLSMQSAGARRGALLLREGTVWRRKVAGDADVPPRLCDDPADRDGPQTLLRYVIRTGDAVVLHEVEGSLFAQDPYLRSRAIGSVMAVPLRRQGAVTAVLYLEHDTVRGAFTDERVETVRLLMSQAAISIENALLYDGLEAKVRERTEQLVAARERAEVASRAKSEFLGNMSHELRTPLNAILGYAQILARQPGVTPTQADGLDIIGRSGRHLLALINDILDMGRIEAGRFELAPGEVDLQALVRSVVDALKVDGRRKGIQVGLEVRTELTGRVRADERRLRQVLLNLVGNAVKFTAQGSVLLRVERPAARTFRFVIEDTGVGIAPDRLQAIFEPFEQEGDADQRAQGTGLGLAISRQIVELMGGRLDVESTPGVGSRFWFDLDLPPATGPTSTPPGARVIGYVGRRRRILVADDAKVNRLVLLDLLTPLGFDVALATDGREAVEMARAEAPDLVLMDMVMPALGGPEAARALRALPGLAGVPVVAVTASIHDAVGVGAEFVDELVKPVELDRLLDVVGRALRLEWTVDEAEPITDTSGTFEIPSWPSAADLQQLRDLARSGDLHAVASAAQEMVERDPALRAFAARLGRLAEDFDDEGVDALLATDG